MKKKFPATNASTKLSPYRGLRREKNLNLIPHLAKQIDNVRFIIIGNLHHKEVYLQLKKLIHELGVENRVILMTDVPKPLLKQILLESKIYLHCAVNEHFGISLIEAMACGCLPIANDSGGPKEFVPENLRYTSMDEVVSKIIKILRIGHRKKPRKCMTIL